MLVCPLLSKGGTLEPCVAARCAWFDYQAAFPSAFGNTTAICTLWWLQERQRVPQTSGRGAAAQVLPFSAVLIRRCSDASSSSSTVLKPPIHPHAQSELGLFATVVRGEGGWTSYNAE